MRDLFGRDQARGFALVGTAFSLGSFLAPVIGGVLEYPCEIHGWLCGTSFGDNPFFLPWVIAAVLSWCAGIGAMTFLPETVISHWSCLAPRDTGRGRDRGGGGRGRGGEYGVRGATDIKPWDSQGEGDSPNVPLLAGAEMAEGAEGPEGPEGVERVASEGRHELASSPDPTSPSPPSSIPSPNSPAGGGGVWGCLWQCMHRFSYASPASIR